MAKWTFGCTVTLKCSKLYMTALKFKLLQGINFYFFYFNYSFFLLLLLFVLSVSIRAGFRSSGSWSSPISSGGCIGIINKLKRVKRGRE